MKTEFDFPGWLKTNVRYNSHIVVNKAGIINTRFSLEIHDLTHSEVELLLNTVKHRTDARDAAGPCFDFTSNISRIPGEIEESLKKGSGS